ncbi:hypothetical protein DFJ58DRAFT_836217 [Suillus subalutaceus]|uniref:uncharacterized protein n=1 Tax=Suillus subalutaceus TaxID=48586 RepID=UPI001B85EA26|nr:uncharacterized protein DFJ58DRAFT_836217 [Suillus subalutaceus]KAG1875628.1 hypothetical protein DFJ58DRAFT_836217 [Suillus subalutaceus]
MLTVVHCLLSVSLWCKLQFPLSQAGHLLTGGRRLDLAPPQFLTLSRQHCTAGFLEARHIEASHDPHGVIFQSALLGIGVEPQEPQAKAQVEQSWGTMAIPSIESYYHQISSILTAPRPSPWSI